MSGMPFSSEDGVVSREFQIPCVMGTAFAGDAMFGIDGAVVRQLASEIVDVRRDLDAVVDWTETTAQVDPTRLVVMGHSMGAAAALAGCGLGKDAAEFIDGELDRRRTGAFRRHLDQCEGCNLAYNNQLTLRSTFKDNSLYYHAPQALKKRIRSFLKIPQQRT